MAYVDGFMAAVADDKKHAYLEHARETSVIFKKHGALSVVECWGDDVPDGELTSMPMAVKKAEGETVVFSWITWPDKAARDAGWENAMKDMEGSSMADMPFDGKRMIFGGFDMVMDA
ncbi:MAG: DUF1428 domain-containing protein [Pseudomonadota bacterium]